MIFLIFCFLVTVAILGAHVAMIKNAWIYCAFYGHDPKCSIVGYEMRWHCEHCGKQVGPL